MNIQSKMTSLLSLIGIVFIIFILYQFDSQNKSFAALLQDTKKQQVSLFDKLLDEKGKNIEIFVSDYTFWDQMVAFISSKDQTFAEENIDTGAETFNANVVEVYDPKHTLIYDVKGEGIVIPQQVFEQLDKDRFIHFFMSVKDAIIEIRGATIHPTDDVERKTTPRGYFFAGKIFDDGYIQIMADITRSSIFILPQNDKGLDTIDSSQGYISFVRDLAGWDGAPVGYLHVEKVFLGISQFHAALFRQFWFFGAFLFILIFFVYGFLIRFVARPLRILSRSIRGGDIKPIEGMQEKKSEFGDLAGLVLKFSEKVDIAKTDFISLVSHQLRTPITIIGWYVERLQKILKKESITGSKSEEYINGISEANRRMVELVNATVEISRIESGNLNLKLEEVDLAHIIDEVEEDLTPAINKKQISFEKKYDSDLPKPILDERLVFIIIENLLSNAVKYTDISGKISIHVSKEKEGVSITVSDNGIGISDDERNRIFEKLFRTETARKKDPEGSGLGLYIVKGVTKTLGGTIEFNSSEGKGTTFLVKLPLFVSK